jgi:anti-anti-sigma factor
MTTPLTLNTGRRIDGSLVLTAVGELDLSNIDTFTPALSSAVAEAQSSGGLVTVDLSAVEYLDSAAINVLFTHAEHVQVFANPILMSAFTVSGLTGLVTVETAPLPDS